MEKQTNQLIEDINNFDLYYEMSDSHNIITAGTNKENGIKMRLKQISPAQRKNMEWLLNNNGKQCWKRYFKNV